MQVVRWNMDGTESPEDYNFFCKKLTKNPQFHTRFCACKGITAAANRLKYISGE